MKNTCVSEGRIPKDKKTSRGRGRRTSEEDAPVKKKPKRRLEISTDHRQEFLALDFSPKVNLQ